MFGNSQVTNTYRPDRKLLDALTALTARVEALEAEKVLLRAENADLLLKLEALILWAKTLTTRESSGAPG